MKVAVFYPEKGVYTDNKNWMYFLWKALEDRLDVYHNTCPDDVDVIIGFSISQIDRIKNAHLVNPKIPLILYNWDMHPLLQPEVGKWDEIGWDVLLNDCLDVWTQTEYHAQLADYLTDVRHFVIPMGALDFEVKGMHPKDKGYFLMASRRVPYKGFEMFEEACTEIGVPFISRHPAYDDRKEYLQDLAGCTAVVIASEEEANTPMSGYEGAFLGKPLILRNHPALREEWEENAMYFNDKDGLKSCMKNISYEMGIQTKKRAEFFKLQAFADRIYTRLCEVL